MSTAVVHRPVLSEHEARELTDRISDTANDLCVLLLEAHEREAWKALGYPSWQKYIELEFRKTRQWAHLLINQARVISQLTEAAGTSTMVDITERTARQIKPHMPMVTAKIRELVADGEDPTTAVREVVRSARSQHASGCRPTPPATLIATAEVKKVALAKAIEAGSAEKRRQETCQDAVLGFFEKWRGVDRTSIEHDIVQLAFKVHDLGGDIEYALDGDGYEVPGRGLEHANAEIRADAIPVIDAAQRTIDRLLLVLDGPPEGASKKTHIRSMKRLDAVRIAVTSLPHSLAIVVDEWDVSAVETPVGWHEQFASEIEDAIRLLRRLQHWLKAA